MIEKGCSLRKWENGKFVYCGKEYLCRQCKTKNVLKSTVLTGEKEK